MAKCLSLNKAGEYAIAALARLALRSSAEPMPIPALAREQLLPESFLSKIVAQCARAGLLRTLKGAQGGVVLARPAERISLLEIIEAFEGEYWRDSCVFYPARPCDGPACPIYCPLRQKEQAVRDELARTTLASMAASLKYHPDNHADAAPAAKMEEVDGNRR